MTDSGITDEIADARSAGLRYVDDATPGYSRKRAKTGFAFFDRAGKKLTDEAEIARIKSLAIPPAYESVWICPFPNGHVQATARDAKGRKQYRYHKKWREVRDAGKYESTLAFALALPVIRKRVAADIGRDCMDRQKVLATVVRLLEDTLVRVGNEGYAKENGSFGLTTLRGRHVKIEGEKRIRLRFRGKSGVQHEITVEDRRLARTIKRCRDLPGEKLFEYRADDGTIQPVHSSDVNAYLREICGGDFSAKDFRTWAGTVACARELESLGAAGTQAAAKQNVTLACAAAAKRLGNTPAVCRKAYVHPTIIETYLDDHVLVLPKPRATAATRGLDDDERRVYAFLKAAQKTTLPKKR
jgi:DNA topoisomerase-1